MTFTSCYGDSVEVGFTFEGARWLRSLPLKMRRKKREESKSWQRRMRKQWRRERDKRRVLAQRNVMLPVSLRRWARGDLYLTQKQSGSFG
jgi:hypothetical protein